MSRSAALRGVSNLIELLTEFAVFNEKPDRFDVQAFIHGNLCSFGHDTLDALVAEHEQRTDALRRLATCCPSLLLLGF